MRHLFWEKIRNKKFVYVERTLKKSLYIVLVGLVSAILDLCLLSSCMENEKGQ